MICFKCNQELEIRSGCHICDHCNLMSTYVNNEFYKLYVRHNSNKKPEVEIAYIVNNGEVYYNSKRFYLGVQISSIEEAYSILKKFLDNLMFE